MLQKPDAVGVRHELASHWLAAADDSAYLSVVLLPQERLQEHQPPWAGIHVRRLLHPRQQDLRIHHHALLRVDNEHRHQAVCMVLRKPRQP